MPPTQVRMQNMQRYLAEKVLYKACSDPQWKQQLIEDPELAMREANFPELQQLQQASQPSGGERSGSVLGRLGCWGGRPLVGTLVEARSRR